MITFRRLFIPGDIDGFFGIALENLVKVLLIVSLCQKVLGFPISLIYGRILPGVALSVVIGNLYYSWLAFKQSEQQGKNNLTAMPYGIDIVSLLGHLFLVMLPIRTSAIAQGVSIEQAAELAWQAGLVACLGSGIIKLGGIWVVNFLRKSIPLAAHLATLGGIALTFITMGFFLRTFAYPVVSLVPLGVIFLTYFGRVKFALPGGLLAILLGTALAWVTGLMSWDNAQFVEALQLIGVYFPGIYLGKLWLSHTVLWEYFSVIFPLGIFNLINSFQNLESAQAAGDSYPPTPALIADGVSTIIAAVCGSCFPTTIYIGHPGWKVLGCGRSYSLLSGIFTAILCFSGTVSLLTYFVPIEAGMAIFIWVGLCIVAQSFTATPPHHAPAVVVGLLPGIAAWGALVAKEALSASGLGTPTHPFTPVLIERFQLSNLFIHGAFALEQGYIFTAIILSSMTVYIIEQEFQKAAIWSLVAAICSWLGLMHSYRWTVASTVGDLRWGAGASWAVGYCLLASLLIYTHLRGDAVKR
jgi:AGZA family xanthine/uracil permease-like MFS transporter